MVNQSIHVDPHFCRSFCDLLGKLFFRVLVHVFKTNMAMNIETLLDIDQVFGKLEMTNTWLQISTRNFKRIILL